MKSDDCCKSFGAVGVLTGDVHGHRLAGSPLNGGGALAVALIKYFVSVREMGRACQAGAVLAVRPLAVVCNVEAGEHRNAITPADLDDLLYVRADLIVVNLFFVHELLPMLVAGCFPDAPGCPGAAVKVSVQRPSPLLATAWVFCIKLS